MNYIRSVRESVLPKVVQIWENLQKSQDEIDTTLPSKSLFETFEPYLVALQELGLWTNPQNSAVALLIFHFIYFFLSYCCSSILYITAWIGLIGFVYTTWTQRVWPVIRVEEPENERPDSEDFTPMNPECFTAPEMREKYSQCSKKVADIFNYLKEMRSEKPGRFCVVSCIFFIFLSILGRSLTIFKIFYLCGIAILTLPAILKLILQYPPAAHYFLKTVSANDDHHSLSDPIPEQSDDNDLGHKETATASSTLAQMVSKGSHFLSDMSKSVWQSSSTQEEQDFDLNPDTSKPILDEIDSSEGVMLSEEERTSQIIIGDTKEQPKMEENPTSLDSLDPFTKGLDAIPGIEDFDRQEQTNLVKDEEENEQFLPTCTKSEPLLSEDSMINCSNHDIQDQHSPIDASATMPSFNEEEDDESVSDQPRIDDPESSSEEDIKNENAMMLKSALEEPVGGNSQSSGSNDEQEEFEVITQEELNLL